MDVTIQTPRVLVLCVCVTLEYFTGFKYKLMNKYKTGVLLANTLCPRHFFSSYNVLIFSRRFKQQDKLNTVIFYFCNSRADS